MAAPTEFVWVLSSFISEEDAIRSYLRVVRLGGENRSDALFKLSLTFFQRGDILRALAYFEAFASSGRSGVADDMAQLLERQLAAAVCSSSFSSRRRRAAQLEKRAVQSLHAGRMHAAKRNAERAIRLEETAQRHLLKACCHLTLEECNATPELLPVIVNVGIHQFHGATL